MEIIDTFPIWTLAAVIFGLRVVDVSLGTVRTLSVVQGWVPLAMALGFTEILVWVTAISHVITNISQHPYLPFAYAGGFAVGNAVGITLERRLALGNVAVRLITEYGEQVTKALGDLSHVVTSINGTGSHGPVQLLYITCQRRNLAKLIATARNIDTALFYVVERFAETSRLAPLPQPTGWRAVLKKK